MWCDRGYSKWISEVENFDIAVLPELISKAFNTISKYDVENLDIGLAKGLQIECDRSHSRDSHNQSDIKQPCKTY